MHSRNDGLHSDTHGCTRAQWVTRLGLEVNTMATPPETPPKKRGRYNLDVSWHDSFLTAYGATGTLKYALRTAGVDRKTYQRHRDRLPEFAQACEDAKEDAIARLEDEAHKRAMGQSDTLLIFLLKHLKPEVYNPAHKVDLAQGRARIVVKIGNDPEYDVDQEYNIGGKPSDPLH